VKTVDYSDENAAQTDKYIKFVNYIGETLQTAVFIAPGFKQTDDTKKLITVSKFAIG
jgi:hypothetical protein